MRYVFVALMWVGLVVPPVSARADCKDEVRDMREDINDNKGDYSGDARREAKKHLAAAELTVLKPLECREHLRKARRALREGNKD
ncbi:MAG: hypothetical protein H6905_07310 [Hyphomicrobiales bacterium]|nr:hypothetical protein [Hyphomicrobiales bacterium]